MKYLLQGCALALAATLTSGEVTPGWTEADLEADWMIQARVSPENLAVLAQRDAAGVNDGVISAEAEHQTQSDAWAWWQRPPASERGGGVRQRKSDTMPCVVDGKVLVQSGASSRYGAMADRPAWSLPTAMLSLKEECGEHQPS